MVKLETTRLRLREFTPADFADMHEMLADAEVMTYYPAVKTESESGEWLDRIIASYATSGTSFWAAVSKATGEILGQVGLIDHRIPEADSLEIGYLLKRKHWHQGYAREAATACRDFAFGELNQPKVISMIDPRNEPSIRVAKSIGMTFEKQSFVAKFDKVISFYAVKPT